MLRSRLLSCFGSVAVVAPVAANKSFSDSSFSPKEFRKFPITKIKQLTPDTKEFVCALPTSDSTMGMDVSSCVMIKTNKLDENNKVVAKPYTPTSTNSLKGEFELVIKVYPTGKVSKYLDGLSVGDDIEVKGPFAKLKYGVNMKKSIGFVCGGSGITPCLQVIREIVENPEDSTQVHLVYANNTVEDIILRDELDRLAAKHSNLQVTYVVANNPTYAPLPKGCYTGFVNEAMLKATMPAPATDSLVYVCGPPPMMDAICGNKRPPKYDQGQVEGLLRDLGYDSTMVFKF